MENDTVCHRKHRISMEIQTVLFFFVHGTRFLYFSFTPLLLCNLVFEHVSGSDFSTDWNRCCVWIAVALFWCNCNNMYECIWRLWWKRFFIYFFFLWLRAKGQTCYPAHPVCLRVGVVMLVWVNTTCTNQSAPYGQLTHWSKS